MTNIVLTTITPVDAGKIMDEHWKRVQEGTFMPRPISVGTIAKYMMDMRNGYWRLAPDPIAFDTNDNLIQGQHRLEAVRRSGVTCEFYVSKGWEASTMDVLDTGKSRSVGAIMAMKGLKNTTALAGTVGGIARIPYRGHASGLTYTQASYILKELGLMNDIEEMMRTISSKKDFVGHIFGPLCYYHSVRPKKAFAFGESLFKFNTTEGSPVRLFLNWQKTSKGVPQVTKLQIMCFCIRIWDEGKTVSKFAAGYDDIVWLANQNPKLRDWIRSHVSRGGMGAVTPSQAIQAGQI